MSEGPTPPVAEAAVVEEKSRPSMVWLIPVVAALIGLFLVYRSYMDRGPTITVSFKSAAGLEAGKTKVKFKDVEIGHLTSIELADDLSNVIVTAELVKGASKYLTENTRFWVVRAQVSAGRITGLGTIFSGAYIGIDPSEEGKRLRQFVGLDEQPVVTSTDPGTTFALESSGGGSYDVGAPVFYRRVEVGEILSSRLDDSGNHVDVQIFVRAPHDERVHSGTRFWDAGGLDFSVNAEGLRIDTQSVTSILIGGIAFDDGDTLAAGKPPEPGHLFPLYANRQEAFSRTYAIKRLYRLEFEHSVEGLRPEAPVVFQGIRVGEVLDVQLMLDRETLEFHVPVLIALEPERVRPRQEIPDDPTDTLDVLVKKGLRARLKSGNLLTGQKEIELVMLEDAKPVEIAMVGEYPTIPTVPTPLEELTTNIATVVERLGKVPLEDIGKNLDSSLAKLSATLENTSGLTRQLESEILPSLAAVSRDAGELLSPTSTVNTELRELLLELTDAARSLRLLADYLERHPEALIQGKEGGG